MKRALGIALGGILFIGAPAFAASAPGNCYNGGTPGSGCSPAVCPGDPANPDCSADDSGCVSNTKNHQKCGAGIGKAFGSLVGAVIKCHQKQADSRFKGATTEGAGGPEETCEQAALTKLNNAFAKVQPICDPLQVNGFNLERATLMNHPPLFPGLDLDHGGGSPIPVYCDSTSGSRIEDKECEGGSNNENNCSVDADCPGGKCVLEDDGWVADTKNHLKCSDAEGKALGKLVAAAIKCHSKMDGAFFKSKGFDEESCENAALTKYNATRDKTLPVCAPCNSTTNWDGASANAVGTVDAANNIAYPCNLGP